MNLVILGGRILKILCHVIGIEDQNRAKNKAQALGKEAYQVMAPLSVSLNKEVSLLFFVYLRKCQ